MAALPIYAHDILSLHDLYNDVFPLRYSFLDFDQSIEAGAPISEAHLTHAKSIATALKCHSGEVFLRHIDP